MPYFTKPFRFTDSKSPAVREQEPPPLPSTTSSNDLVVFCIQQADECKIKGEYDNAILHLNAGITIQGVTDLFLIKQLYMKMINCLIEIRDFDNCIRMTNFALSQNLHIPEFSKFCYLKKATSYSNISEHAKAIEVVDLGLSLESENSPIETANFYFVKSFCHIELEEYDKGAEAANLGLRTPNLWELNVIQKLQRCLEKANKEIKLLKKQRRI